jgi:hypothetical protein
VIKHVTEASFVQLEMLNGEVLRGMVNGICWNTYNSELLSFIFFTS